MAWLEQKLSGTFHIASRINDAKFKKSPQTKSEREADARVRRVEENGAPARLYEFNPHLDGEPVPVVGQPQDRNQGGMCWSRSGKTLFFISRRRPRTPVEARKSNVPGRD